MSSTFNTHDGQRVGRRANVFQPPRTPSASSSVRLTQPASSIMMEKHKPLIVNKKRGRHDSTTGSIATPISQILDWSNGYPTGDSIARSGSIDPGSPMPFVNTRYQIAGGFDTPTAAAANFPTLATAETFQAMALQSHSLRPNTTALRGFHLPQAWRPTEKLACHLCNKARVGDGVRRH
jgi:hypothetical protein